MPNNQGLSNDAPSSQTPHDEAESAVSRTEQQEQEEQRIQTEERMSMDPADMADAIDQEEDQKFDGGRKTRYQDEVAQVLPDDAH